MEPLTTLTSVVIPLLLDDVNTDAIIPAAYMRSLTTDPATGLFAGWRYMPDGSPNPAFVLNDKRYDQGRILLAGENFGCGSSRENAVWALAGNGIRCVIAKGFSDIFRENAYKNGVLPVVLAAPVQAELAALATQRPLTLTVDVAEKKLIFASQAISFELDPRRQVALLSGADEIAETLQKAVLIDAFRMAHRQRAPWLYAPMAQTTNTSLT
jgi:3-isopropylmalate/(R)-2-methylmalate dehydratase small subunit